MFTHRYTLIYPLWPLLRAFRRQWGMLTCMLVTIALAGALGALVIWPGYRDPSSRMYTSRLGYARVLRAQNKPFPVTTVRPEQRAVSAVFLGEGLVQSEPVQVPVIPMSRIVRVHVEEGDRVTKGQLLAELDDTRARIKIEAARAAIKTAQAELERTRIGSAYVLDQERPERDKIRLEECEEEASIKTELARISESLLQQNVVSRGDYLKHKLDAVQATSRLKQTRWAFDVAQAGRQHSLLIAESAIAEAELALAHRLHEIADYKIYAPADGIIERCLIHAGEYNQDPGKPAFLIASGTWFNAYLDQTAIGQFEVGVEAEVYLEAFPGQTIAGRITKIHPVVSYNLGGPETNRPIRPLGTGAPEWPATFSVQIELERFAGPLVPGLTGFARITTSRRGIAVPRGAVQSVSASKGIVFVVQGQEYEPREVSLGFSSDGWMEIRAGLTVVDTVIADGHQVLEPGDRIKVTEPSSQAASTEVGRGEAG